ncbi:MAG: redoxin domain-containing protein [Pirellulales bacterium]|nr:redoxin domain-containing protein [Pirellulales bacterium]
MTRLVVHLRLSSVAAFALVAALSLVARPTSAAEATKDSVASSPASLGQQVADFTLADYRGKEVSLADYKDSKAVVLAFLGVECPLARAYAPRLTELAKEFADKNVAFLVIDANRQDSLSELAHFARQFSLELPLLKDPNQQVADAVGATRTPEVFVLDTESRVRYAGRIDDQFGVERGGSFQRPQPTRRDLAVALDQVLAGQPVEVAHTTSTGCLIGRARPADAQATITFTNQIARIFNKRCVECHRPGQIGPFALTSYDEAAGWSEMIAEVVREGRMPPWHADPQYGHFANDARLSDEERDQIFAWVAAGAPRGDEADLPPTPSFVEGWQMPQAPDLVVRMQDTPFEVPAEGTVAYKYFVTDPGFTEDKWVRVAECLPDNRAVVHHIIVFIRPPDGTPSADRRGFNFLVGYAPGTRPMVAPEHAAKRIPAGSKLVFQMHYTPIGTPEQDCSSVGLVFVKDPSTITHEVVTTSASNHTFAIPAGADNHEVLSARKFGKDTLLLSFFPHMHLRGKSFRYELELADGSREILLDVPRYDFNWQNHFLLTEPRVLPKDSVLRCTAHFDNSADNPANPDPSETVRWGDQTWEEMMIGWYDALLPRGETLDAVPVGSGADFDADDGE